MVTLPRDGHSADREPNTLFSTDVDGAIEEAELVLNAVNTHCACLLRSAGLAPERMF